MTDVQTETHFVLWLLIAFALGTLWEPVVMLVEPAFTIDNQEREPANE